jgi:hypothetical protein
MKMEKQRTPRVLRQQVLGLLIHDDGGGGGGGDDDDDNYDYDYHYHYYDM